MDANQTTEGTTFERRFLPLPPWPNDLQAVRDKVFPDWYRCDELMTALDAWVVVAHRASKVVGYAQADDGLNQGSCYLREIAVTTAHRHQGLGRRLVFEIGSWLRERAMDLMYAYPLEDDDYNVRAAWFESMGFREPDPLTTYRADIEDMLHFLRQELDL